MEEQQPLSVTVAEICKELENVFVTAEASGLAPRQTIVKEIMKTATGGGHVVVHGIGRKGLMMKGSAMRLFHLGLNTAYVRDMTAPHVGPGDLLIASAGVWFGSVNAIIVWAKQDGVRVLLLTAQPGGSAARLADVVAVVPAQTVAHDVGKTCASILLMGSLYEGALFLLFEMAILALAPALK